MKRPFLLLALLLFGLALTLPSYAQEANEPPTDASSEYHYKDGPYGYRAEILLMDSLAVLEMMEVITPTEAKEKKEKFRKEKKVAKQKKEKKEKEKKKKKDKEKKKDKG